MRPALLFYCQHSVGLGHLMRSYALCRGLAERFRVVLVVGGQLPDGIAPPPGVELVPLPPLGVEGGRFRSQDHRLSTERAWAVRSERIQATLREVRPDVVFVELFPFGRAKFARELVPLLEAARARGAFTACSLRDILVSSRPDQRAYDDRARELADAHLDAVLVHCDPRFARLEETFSPTVPLHTPIHYTGFVTNLKTTSRGTVPFREREPVIVISAGGGRVGEPLLRAALECPPPRGMRLRAIAGPLMPEDAFRNLKTPVPTTGTSHIKGTVPEVVRWVPDLAVELARASGSVSQCGYNTALEVLLARVPALVVPYATPEEDEQMRRARRLERLGVLKVSGLDRLAEDIRDLEGFTPAGAALDLNGAQRTTELLWDLRPARAAA
jgi:predicted glycosyltransferase